MQHRLYQIKIKDLDYLKHCLNNVWVGILQSIINDAIKQWHKLLHACVKARDGYFEHLL